MRLLFLLILVSLCAHTQAQDTPPHDAITLQRAGATLAADFHPAGPDAPVLLLMHMLNSERAAWQPILPDLHAAGYAILNVDLRGHGGSGRQRDWQAAIADAVDGWGGWLRENDHAAESGLAIMGGSIGANLAIISCAEISFCRGAIALSPGLDYRGLQPESALVDGLADRSALLLASQADASSSAAIRQMFSRAKGAVTARLYPGRAHGTRLFDSDYDSLSGLILGWLRRSCFPVPRRRISQSYMKM